MTQGSAPARDGNRATRPLSLRGAPPVSIRARGLWHCFGAEGSWSPRPGADRDETLRELHAQGAGDSFVLHVPDFEVRAGEFLCLVGPSGCGKTTLLSILGLLREPTWVDELALHVGALDDPDNLDPLVIQRGARKIDARTKERLRMMNVGFALQSGSLLGALSSQENVDLPLHATGRYLEAAKRAQTTEERDALFDALFRQRSRPGLGEDRLAPKSAANSARVRGLRPSMLSGGQRQRVLLARSIVHRPVLVFADEPTNNLDQQSAFAAVEALLEMREQWADTTIVMVTHDLALPERFDLPLVRLRSFPEAPWFGTLEGEPAPRLGGSVHPVPALGAPGEETPSEPAAAAAPEAEPQDEARAQSEASAPNEGGRGVVALSTAILAPDSTPLPAPTRYAATIGSTIVARASAASDR